MIPDGIVRFMLRWEDTAGLRTPQLVTVKLIGSRTEEKGVRRACSAAFRMEEIRTLSPKQKQRLAAIRPRIPFRLRDQRI